MAPGGGGVDRGGRYGGISIDDVLLMSIDGWIERHLRAAVVSIDDEGHHDRDLLVSMGDEQRAALRSLILREQLHMGQVGDRRRRFDDEQPVRAWHETVWGRAGIVAAWLVVGMQVYSTFLHH